MLSIKRKYKNLKRINEIIFVASKYGLGYYFDKVKLKRFVKVDKDSLKKPKSKIASMSMAERARLVFENLGPAFVKFGQALSTHPDLLPRNFIDEFSKLQDKVPIFPFSEVQQAIERELNGKIEDLFLEFDEKPLAAASLGQVHKAKLKSGEVVAVKVQRPGVEESVKTDISVLFDLISFLEKGLIDKEIYQPVELVREFSRSVLKELDYVNEGRNIDKFHYNFERNEHVFIPQVFWDYTTSNILTMELVDGVKISETEKIKAFGLDKKIIAKRGANIVLKQVFEDGFFHADPHPGNLFVLADGRIAMLDFGLVGRVDEAIKLNIANLLIAGVENNAEKVIDELEKMELVIANSDRGVLRRDISEFIDKYHGASLKQLEISLIIQEIFDILIAHRIKIPSNLSLLAKALATAEGVGRRLDPDFDIVVHAQPFVKKMISQEYSLTRLLRRGSNSLWELLLLFEILPKEISTLLKNLKNGELNVNFKHQGLNNLVLEVDRASNRIAFSLIIAALIVGSSIILTQDIGPYIFSYPAIGIIGFLLASFLGLFLAFSILRSGRWK